MLYIPIPADPPSLGSDGAVTELRPSLPISCLYLFDVTQNIGLPVVAIGVGKSQDYQFCI
jgi:hypothetical protein